MRGEGSRMLTARGAVEGVTRWLDMNDDSVAALALVAGGTLAIVEPAVLLAPVAWVVAIFAKAWWLKQRDRRRAAQDALDEAI